MEMRVPRSILPLGAVAAALLLSACEQPPAPTRVAEDGTVLIQVNAGLRCHQGQCLEFDPVWNEARIRPFDYVALPRGTRVGGVLTEAQFRDLYEQARRAPLGGREPEMNF
jgi:hypothetical protein